MLRTGEQTVYHVMSRTALDGFPLGTVEKDYLVNFTITATTGAAFSGEIALRA
jgi:hypothetical protein